MHVVFFTGFPGFLGRELLPRVLDRELDARAVCLVQPKFMKLAESARAELIATRPALEGRIDLVAGDITEPDLGLGNERAALRDRVTSIFHLAAVYDLAVGEALARKVNVEGTKNLLAFAASARSLERLDYVSTCYVSGRHHGTFREADLELGQRFHNFYESTKFEAEVLVRRAMEIGLPATIYRPSIVVGDSRTGVTQKYDGPYYIIRWILRQKRFVHIPVVANPKSVRFNVVPRDFVVSAIAHLSGEPRAIGKTYQLADPEPPTVDELLDGIARATSRDVARIRLPGAFVKALLGSSDFVAGRVGIPSESLDYLAHPTLYDTTNASTDLARAGLHCPRLRDYLPTLVAYVRAHPEISASAMV